MSVRRSKSSCQDKGHCTPNHHPGAVSRIIAKTGMTAFVSDALNDIHGLLSDTAGLTDSARFIISKQFDNLASISDAKRSLTVGIRLPFLRMKSKCWQDVRDWRKTAYHDHRCNSYECSNPMCVSRMIRTVSRRIVRAFRLPATPGECFRLKAQANRHPKNSAYADTLESIEHDYATAGLWHIVARCPDPTQDRTLTRYMRRMSKIAAHRRRAGEIFRMMSLHGFKFVHPFADDDPHDLHIHAVVVDCAPAEFQRQRDELNRRTGWSVKLLKPVKTPRHFSKLVAYLMRKSALIGGQRKTPVTRFGFLAQKKGA